MIQTNYTDRTRVKHRHYSRKKKGEEKVEKTDCSKDTKFYRMYIKSRD